MRLLPSHTSEHLYQSPQPSVLISSDTREGKHIHITFEDTKPVRCRARPSPTPAGLRLRNHTLRCPTGVPAARPRAVTGTECHGSCSLGQKAPEPGRCPSAPWAQGCQCPGNVSRGCAGPFAWSKESLDPTASQLRHRLTHAPGPTLSQIYVPLRGRGWENRWLTGETERRATDGVHRHAA